jgi:putative transposase
MNFVGSRASSDRGDVHSKSTHEIETGKPRMPFRVCYYHVIWATRSREPTISPEIEAVITAAIQRKSEALRSPIQALNTATDHVHVAVSISTSLAVSEWVKQVKGLSAYEVNAAFPALPAIFRWQRSYGVLTFGAKQLPLVVDYIRRQKEHHAHNQIIHYLEHTGDE